MAVHLLNRMEEAPVYNEFAEISSMPPTPAPKTTVADNAVKISAHAKTGEYSVETGRNAAADTVQAVAKSLQGKVAELDSLMKESDAQAKEIEKTKKAAEDA